MPPPGRYQFVLRPGQVVALTALALLVFGVVMVNSAGMSVAPVGADAPTTDGITVWSVLLSRPTLYLGLAVTALAVGSILPVRRIADLSLRTKDAADHPLDGLGLYAAGAIGIVLVLCLVYVPFLRREVNGSARWIAVNLPGAGAVSVQPSELAKWGLLVLLAWYGAKRAKYLGSFTVGLAPALLGVGLIVGVIVLEDLGTAALIAGAAGVILLASGARVLHFAAMVPFVLVALGAAIVTSPYRVQRLITFVNPYNDPQGAGYHMIQSLQTVTGGGGFGRGLGHGIQKFGYLPEDTTDFLYAVISEELGIAGAALVISLYVAMLFAGLMIVKAERSTLLKLFGLGVLATIGFQAVINLAVVTGLGPTKGIALPLISAGGTGWILTCASLGLLVAMDRAQLRDQIEDAQDAPERAVAVPIPEGAQLPRSLKPRIRLGSTR